MKSLPIVALLFLFFQQGPELDYQYFKQRVQPIFLKKRPGHARCVTCHSHGSPPLQPLAAPIIGTVEPAEVVTRTPRSSTRGRSRQIAEGRNPAVGE